MNITKPFQPQFIGQIAIMQQIEIKIAACKLQNMPFGHTLLVGGAGMGKTTIAKLIASQLAAKFHFVEGTNINRIADMISLLTNLKPFDVIFLDEIHAINSTILEILYPALERQYIQIVIGKDYNNKIIKIDLPPFTFIAATSKVALLNKALLSRINNIFQLQKYQMAEIKALIKSTAEHFNWQISDVVINEISNYCRPVPRIIINLMRQVYDYCLVKNINLTQANIQSIMQFFQVYWLGLNYFELNYLRLFANNQFLSLETISSLLNEEIKNIEVNYEPFLLQLGLINKSSKGRKITDKGINYLETNHGFLP